MHACDVMQHLHIACLYRVMDQNNLNEASFCLVTLLRVSLQRLVTNAEEVPVMDDYNLTIILPVTNPAACVTAAAGD